jgi:hypothetical protein
MIETNFTTIGIRYGRQTVQCKRSVKRHEVVQPEDPEVRLIPLTKGKNSIVDAADYDWLMQWNWFAMWNPPTSSFYAYRASRVGIKVAMHNEILGISGTSLMADHKSGDTLDNRRLNIRPSTYLQNNANHRMRKDNKSGFHGVCWHKQAKKWISQCSISGVSKYIGLFPSAEHAARARDAVVFKIYGEFAQLNFPMGERCD